jgi:hypothetical protein
MHEREEEIAVDKAWETVDWSSEVGGPEVGSRALRATSERTRKPRKPPRATPRRSEVAREPLEPIIPS